MTEYSAEVGMDKFELTKARGHQPDDLWFYWKVQVLEGKFQNDGKFPPPVDTQTARLHWPYPVSSGHIVDTSLSKVQPSFFTNPNNPAASRLQSKVTFKAGQVVVAYYFVENLSSEEHDPNSRPRKFNNTVKDVETGITILEVVGSATPAGPFIAAAAEIIKLGLEGAKFISDTVDGEGQPIVSCDGFVSKGVWAIKADDLIAAYAAGKRNDTVTIVDGEPAPDACGGGSTGTATIKYKIEQVPEFIEELHENSATWHESPAFGLPLTVWNGTWGETRNTRQNKIQCEIKVRKLYAPNGHATPPFLALQVREIAGATPHYIVNTSTTVHFTDSEATGSLGPVGAGGQAYSPHSDTIRVDAGNKLIKLQLYSARDSAQRLMEYRIKYTRTDATSAQVLESKMLVPAQRIG